MQNGTRTPMPHTCFTCVCERAVMNLLHMITLFHYFSILFIHRCVYITNTKSNAYCMCVCVCASTCRLCCQFVEFESVFWHLLWHSCVHKFGAYREKMDIISHFIHFVWDFCAVNNKSNAPHSAHTVAISHAA